MICDSKCCRRSGEKIWCKKNLGLKNQKDRTIRYRSEKQTITTVLLGKVFGKKRVRSASGF